MADHKDNKSKDKKEKIPDEDVYKPQKFPYCFPNIFLVARKQMGKTTVIWRILKAILAKAKKIPIIIFCPSLDTDSLWGEIIEWLKKHKHPVYEYYSLINPETRENDLDAMMKHMEKLNRADSKHKKHKIPKYILIMDDLGRAMRQAAVYQFLLKNRHEKCVTIVSAQSMKNITPEVREQINEWMLFPQIKADDLELIHDDGAPPIDFEAFVKEYKAATNKPYSFLYFTPKGIFRTKFGKPRQLGGFGITAEAEAKLREEAKNRKMPEKESAFTQFLRTMGWDKVADMYHKQYGSGEPPQTLIDELKKRFKDFKPTKEMMELTGGKKKK